MATYAGRDPIAEFWRGETSLRQLRVLVENLPPTSAVHRKAAGHSWTDVEYLLAELTDRVGLLAAWTIAANSEGHKLNRPKPVPRPEVKQVARKTERVTDQARAALLSLIERMKPKG